MDDYNSKISDILVHGCTQCQNEVLGYEAEKPKENESCKFCRK